LHLAQWLINIKKALWLFFVDRALFVNL
jgi:hypothetical protein